MAGRFRLRYRYYRCHHREESLALEVLLLALAHWAGLAGAVGHFQQGSGASALARHHDAGPSYCPGCIRTQTLSRTPRFGNDIVPVQTPSTDVPLKNPFRARESSGL